MRIRMNIISTGLVMLVSPPNTPEVAAASQVPASFKEFTMPAATVPKSSPNPVMPAVKLPCSDTHNL